MSADSSTPTTTSDTSPYIRTYAKDVAALTNQKTPSAPAPVTKPPATPVVRGDDSLIVDSTSSRQIPSLSQLESQAENESKHKETEQEVEERLQANTAAALTSDSLQTIDLPSIESGDIVGAPQPAATVTGDREAILERLRSKVAAQRAVPTSPTFAKLSMAPSNFGSVPVIPQSKADSVVPSYREPTPEPPPQPVIAPTPVQLVAPPPPEISPAPFHSFSSDFADRIDTQRASTFSVLAAEKDAPPVKRAARKKKSPLVPILAGILLLIVGGVGVYAAYRYMSSEAPIAAISSQGTIIVPDEKTALTGTGSALTQALAQTAGQPIPVNTVLMTYINTATTTKEGVAEAPASGGAFISAMSLPAPDILLRNIDPNSMVGVVNDGTQTSPFFILRVDSYESTFAGMLSWERTIGSDLSLLYPAYPAAVQTVPIVATSTATTTSKTKIVAPVAPPVVQPDLPPQFVDEVVASHDTRALRDSQGRTILIYGYADKQTLIIAREEAAFTLLLSRYNTSQQ